MEEAFYDIISRSPEDESQVFELRLNTSHSIYKGHFPEMAIVPGAMLIQMTKELAEIVTGKKISLREAPIIKFLKMILPHISKGMKAKIKIEQKPELHIDAEISIGPIVHFKMSGIYSVME